MDACTKLVKATANLATAYSVVIFVMRLKCCLREQVSCSIKLLSEGIIGNS